MSRRLRWLAPLLMVAVLLGAWELYVDAGAVSSLVLPAPHAVLASLFADRATIWHNLVPTAEEILLGLVVAAVCALAVAVLLHLSSLARAAVYPPLVATQAIPIPLLAPLLVTWLGFGLLPKLVVIALVCFFPIVVTTMSGLASVDPDLLKLLRTFGAGRLQTFWRAELPSALPGLFAGAKLAAVLAVIAAILGEQAGASSGLGYLLTVTVANLEMAEAFATVLVLIAFAIMLFALLSVAEHRAVPWIHQRRDTEVR
jgi:NitT/TauT family transport system permease protein/putative hydroxymethylpyrimidine transport system permease protein